MHVERNSAASVVQDRHFHLFDTAFGLCGIAWNADGLVRMQLPERDRTTAEKRLGALGAKPWTGAPPAEILPVIAMLERYFGGEAVDFRPLQLDLQGIEPFNRRVYDALREVGWGATTTYGALAKRVEAPGAAQAVGVAMARNPWPVIVPCHRVLAAKHKTGGFSAHGGAETKLKLLAMEGVTTSDDLPMLPGLFT